MRRYSVRIGIHRHLTIRSSRPHVVASAMCFTLRLHTSAAPPRVGLTQALGGRKAFCECAAHRLDSPASVRASFRTDCRRVATSSKSAGRAHTSHALRSPASASALSFGLRMLSLLTGPAESSRGALMLSRFGVRKVRFGPHLYRHPTRLTIRSSRPRVVASAACFALRLHASTAPPRGGLTQALGRVNTSI